MSEDWGDPDPGRAWRPGVDPNPAQPAYDYLAGTAEPYVLPPRPSFAERARPHAETTVATTALVVLLGAPLALLWRAFATPAVVLRTASGPQPAAPETDQVFAVDGMFVVVTVVAGLLVGAVAWTLLRRRGPAGPVALAVGGLLAALVASAVGRLLVVDRYLYDFCHGPDIHCLVYDGTLRLHSLAAVVAFPAAALLAYAALTSFSGDD